MTLEHSRLVTLGKQARYMPFHPQREQGSTQASPCPDFAIYSLDIFLLICNCNKSVRHFIVNLGFQSISDYLSSLFGKTFFSLPCSDTFCSFSISSHSSTYHQVVIPYFGSKDSQQYMALRNGSRASTVGDDKSLALLSIDCSTCMSCFFAYILPFSSGKMTYGSCDLKGFAATSIRLYSMTILTSLTIC